LSSCHYLEEEDFETAEDAAADRQVGRLNVRKSLEVVINYKIELLLDRDLSSGSSAKEL
jgi:hypothetical protein